MERILEEEERRNCIFFVAYYFTQRSEKRVVIRMSMLWRCYGHAVSCAVSCILERDEGIHERAFVWRLENNLKLGVKKFDHSIV